MTNMKNITINGINYRLCGNIYIPYSPCLLYTSDAADE